jgi:hypothetical protein
VSNLARNERSEPFPLDEKHPFASRTARRGWQDRLRSRAAASLAHAGRIRPGTARAMRAEPNGYTIEMGQMGNGLVPNLNRPGGNTTGVSFLSSASVTCATYMQPLAKTELSMTITD